ncbi:MAG: sensor histidine kinase [Jatrophihabitantaceae bacterium]
MSDTSAGLRALVLLRQAEHVLFLGLLALGAGQSIADGRHPWWSGSLAVLELLWYLLGVVMSRRAIAGARMRGRAELWLAGLTLGWFGLIVSSASFGWMVFAIFFLFLQLLEFRWSIPAVVLLTAVAIGGFAGHQGDLGVSVIVGPSTGAAVAIVITVVYRGLREESQRRALLITELEATQDRLASAERYAGMLAERERLAREIHDTVAQSLASIVLLLGSARDQVGEQSGQARRQLETAVAAARGALDDTRNLVRALTPEALAGQPLTEALRRLVQDARPVGIDLEFEVDGEPYDLPTRTAVALLRTAQGALGNVIAHSMAQHARITLTFQPDRVGLDVADDGRGFDPAAPVGESTAGTGIGLASMRTRLAEVAGTLTVETAPGGGTAIGASIPTEVADD